MLLLLRAFVSEFEFRGFLLEVLDNVLRLLEFILAEEQPKSFQFAVVLVEHLDLVDELLRLLPDPRRW